MDYFTKENTKNILQRTLDGMNSELAHNVHSRKYQNTKETLQVIVDREAAAILEKITPVANWELKHELEDYMYNLRKERNALHDRYNYGGLSGTLRVMTFGKYLATNSILEDMRKKFGDLA